MYLYLSTIIIIIVKLNLYFYRAARVKNQIVKKNIVNAFKAEELAVHYANA